MARRATSSNSKSDQSKSYQVPALEKGLDILELLATQRHPLTQTEIGRALGRSQSEIFRMLTCLERRGYLTNEPLSGAYELTLRLFEMSHAHSPFQQLIRAAEQPMHELTATIRESCHLAILRRDEILTLAQVETREKVRLSVEVGSTMPALQTVSGRLLLALLPEAERAITLEAVAEYKNLPERQQRALRQRLDVIGQRGYEAASSEMVEGVFDVAVPVGSASTVRAALTVAALSRRDETAHDSRVETLLPAVYRCAAAIEQAAGLTLNKESV